MTVAEISEEPTPDPLAKLEFPPPGRKPYPSKLQRTLVFGLLAITSLFVGSLAASQALSGAPIQGPGGMLGSVFYLSVVCFLTITLALVILRLRGFRVKGGVMTLPGPRRTISGKRVRHVALKDIAYVERISQPGADPGILITLRDGTRFPIFDDDAPGLRPFLDRLLTVATRSQPPTSGPIADLH